MDFYNTSTAHIQLLSLIIATIFTSSNEYTHNESHQHSVLVKCIGNIKTIIRCLKTTSEKTFPHIFHESLYLYFVEDVGKITSREQVMRMFYTHRRW